MCVCVCVCFSVNDLRIVLLGKNGLENSRVGNTILGTAVFNSEISSDSKQYSQRISGSVEKRHIAVINTPHLLQPHLSQHQITQGVKECASQLAPGPHAILLVLQYKDFTEEDLRRVKYVLNLFSVKAIKHTIVLTTDDTFISKLTNLVTNNAIQNLIKDCGGGHLQFETRNAGWRSEMFSRIEKILMEVHGEFLVCNRYEDGGTSVDEDPVNSDHKGGGQIYQSIKTGSDGRGLSKSFFPQNNTSNITMNYFFVLS